MCDNALPTSSCASSSSSSIDVVHLTSAYLPQEILALICSLVSSSSLREVCSLMLCNKELYSIASSDDVWRSVWRRLVEACTRCKPLGPFMLARMSGAKPVDGTRFKQKYKAVSRARLILKHTNLVMEGSPNCVTLDVCAYFVLFCSLLLV